MESPYRISPRAVHTAGIALCLALAFFFVAAIAISGRHNLWAAGAGVIFIVWVVILTTVTGFAEKIADKLSYQETEDRITALHRLLALIVRLFGIFQVLSAIRYPIAMFSLMDWPFAVALMGIAVIILLIGAVMIVAPMAIAGKLLPPASAQEAADAGTGAFPPEAERLACLILGIYFLYNSGFEVIRLIARIALVMRSHTFWDAVTPEAAIYLVIGLCETGVALWLLLGARGLLNAIHSLRTAGRSYPAEDTGQP